jgi:uncharacterized protein YjgD (DUF1641 family)
MMTALLETPTSSTSDARIDAMAAQLEFISAELREQQRVRESAAALVHELSPITSAVMNRVTDELQDLDGALTLDDVGQLAKTLALNVNRLNGLLAQLESMTALAATMSELAGPAMALATDKLQVLDDKGYFAFAQQGAAIADRIVTTFGEDDVRALGDNIVLILEAVKEMTQPEIMTMMRRTALTAQESSDSYAEAPSTFAIVRQMRDPEVRRGLARALNILRSLGAEPTSPTNDLTTTATKKD